VRRTICKVARLPTHRSASYRSCCLGLAPKYDRTDDRTEVCRWGARRCTSRRLSIRTFPGSRRRERRVRKTPRGAGRCRSSSRNRSRWHILPLQRFTEFCGKRIRSIKNRSNTANRLLRRPVPLFLSFPAQLLSFPELHHSCNLVQSCRTVAHKK